MNERRRVFCWPLTGFFLTSLFRRAYIVMKPNTSLEEETDASSSQIKMDLAKDVEEWVRERVCRTFSRLPLSVPHSI